MEEVILLNDNPTPAPARAHSPRVQDPVPPIPTSKYRLSPTQRKVLGDGTEELTLDDGGVAPSEVSSAAPQTQKGAGQTPYTITVVLNRGNQGFGFSVAWTKPPRVERVEAGLPADRAGLQAGDYIIFVSHFNVVKSSEDDVLQMIRECGDVLPLEVYRRGVSKHPRGLANGYTPSAAPLPPLNDNETHARKKLSHIAFNTETTAEDRQSLVFQAINSEQAFSNACRFGVERYLIPLTFRGDLITSTQHQTLFGNMDQLMDLSETLVDRLMGNADEAIGDRVGLAYYQLIEEVVQQYTTYLAGLPEGDQVLALKLQEQDFNEFLHEPPVPRKKPDITAFIHKPAEHLREMLGLLTQVYAASGGHPDNAHLDAVLDRLKSCYRGVTSQQNIMEPSPPTPLPPPTAHHTPPPAARPAAPLRPPLVSVGDIEQRLVFTKFTQPFKLNDGKRQWVFGGELYKFEGRHLKQYWAMLFTDLLLFTKINRDRVIFVMEDPVPLAGVCQAIFNIKKKVTEFRLIVDTSVRVPGSAEAGYLSSPSFTRRRRGSTTSTSSSGRANKRTLVIRAPTIDLKATWNNLINRQLYECQLGGSSPLGDFPASSLGRAASSDGLASHHAASGRFSSSVGDLRRGGSQDGDVLVVDLGQGRARGPPASSSSSTSCFRSRKLQYRNGEVEEELELGDDDDEPQVPGRHASPPLSAPVSPPVNAPRVSLTTAAQPEFQFVVEHDDPRTAPRTTKPSRAAKVKRGKGGGGGRSGGARKRGARTGKVNDRGGGGGTDGHEQEIVLSLENEPPRTSVPLLREPSTDSQSALASHRSRTAAEDGALKNKEGEEEYDDEDDEEDDLVIQDIRTGLQSRLNKKKGLGGKVKDKLFPNRHLPKVKKMDRTKKVEKYVDSLMVEDMNHIGRVTPVLPGEENYTQEDFTRTRNHILQSRPKNYQEGAEELIALDSPLSPRRTTTIDQDARRSEMKLEGIDEGARQNLLQTQDSLTGPSAVLSPEDYEDYIGEPVENDYPELAGPSELPTSLTPPASPPPMQAQDSLDYAPQEPAAPEYFQQSEEYYQEEESLPPPAPAPLAVEEPSPSGPLSGSASMNFMDDHSPTNGLAEGRGLKRYGSSCDIAKLVKGVPEDTLYGQDDYCDDDYNGNFDANQKVSKVGGTGSGPFVAGKLAMFEKVVEEEHQKFIEGQEVRKRIFRAPRKSGEYIEKFYSPKVISNVDARAVERCQSPYYEDEYDNLDRSRPCTPRDIETPYGGHSSPRLRTSDSSNVYISKPASPSPRHASPQTKFYAPRSPSPSPRSPSPTPRSLSPPIFKCPPPLARSSPPRARSPSPVARSPSPLAVSNNYQYDNESYPERPMSPSSTQYKADTRQVTPVPASSAGGRRMSPNPTRSQPFCYQESLEQRTDEALEMLDMSYVEDAAPPPSRYTPTAAASPPPSRGQEKIRRGCSTSPPPPAPPVDPLDDVFEIEEEDVTGSTSSIGGRNKRAAPRPPTPPHGAAASPPAEGKLGAFFKGRLGKDSSAPKEKKEKKKKDVDKKGKDKKEKEKKEKEKKEEKGGGAGGKRFQLFGGAKKSSDPHTPPPDSPAASPKKDEKEKGAGKRRLFGRGKENFLGRSSQVNQTSDPQVARMSGGSFDDSINLDDEFM